MATGPGVLGRGVVLAERGPKALQVVHLLQFLAVHHDGGWCWLAAALLTSVVLVF